MKRWHLVVGGVAVVAVAIYFGFFRVSEEDRVREVLEELARMVAVRDGDTVLSRAARLRGGMRELVDDDVRVSVVELGIDVRGRGRLADDATRAGLAFQSATVALARTTVTIDPAGTLAKADATALVTASRGGERRVEERAVHFLLRKDGGWRVTTIDVAGPRSD